VTHVTPAAGAYALETLEVIGEGFGTSAGTSSVTINGVAASATPVSDSHLQVTVPTGATSGALVVTRSGVTSEGYVVTILQGPVITEMTPTWGPEDTTVSISGTNFGSTAGTVQTHGEPTFTLTEWTPTHITAKVPAGAVSGLLTVTDADGHASRGRPFTVDTEEVAYYHSDAIGSVRMVTGVEGAVIERHDFQPFGEEVAGALPMQVGFTAAEKDRETETSSSLGFNYLGLRQLHGASARFLGVDPEHVGGDLGSPQSWNGYAYAGNNPLRFTDPNGRMYEVCWTDGSSESCGYDTDEHFENVVLPNPGAGITVTSLVDPSEGFAHGFFFLGGSVGHGEYTQVSKDPRAGPTPWEGVVRGVQMAEPITEPKVIAAWYGASVLVGGGLAATGVIGGGADLVVSQVGLYQRLRQLQNMWKALPRAERAQLENWVRTITGKNPGLPGYPPPAFSKEALRLYTEIAKIMVNAGADTAGTQAARIAALGRYF
jgi:RHS repeat-associated protein